MTYATITRRKMPEHVPDWELVPKAPAQQGFASRAPAVTQEELAAVDRALAAKKATPSYHDLSDHFALEQQTRGAA